MYKVLLENRTYGLNSKQLDRVLKVASEQVPFGIYAVKCRDYIELRNDRVTSITQLKELKRRWKKEGFKVYFNGV